MSDVSISEPSVPVLVSAAAEDASLGDDNLGVDKRLSRAIALCIINHQSKIVGHMHHFHAPFDLASFKAF